MSYRFRTLLIFAFAATLFGEADSQTESDQAIAPEQSEKEIQIRCMYGIVGPIGTAFKAQSNASVLLNGQ